MTSFRMKIPKSAATRLSTSAWVEAEMLLRHTGISNIRELVETLINKEVTSYLQKRDEAFIAVMTEVREEGVESD